MSIKTLGEMSIREKAEHVVKSADKKMIRKTCGVSPSKFLLLEASGEKKMMDFVEKKLTKLNKEQMDKLMREWIR